MNNIQQLALIGPTASGKSALSIKIAQKMDAYILSLDSLSIYKEIDIVSAKPTTEERKGIIHFGMDILSPNENFDVSTFVKLYQDVYSKALQENKNLLIVGGTSFYLKILMEGISELPTISHATKEEASRYLQDLQKTYAWLYSLDSAYMKNIASNDSYRIEKVLHIYLETDEMPSVYFKHFPPKPTITAALPVYQIDIPREILRDRIALRTLNMLKNGLISEVCALEKIYTRAPHCMKAIGIKETLAYLDGVYDKTMLIEKITTNTTRLAKRQTTFNNSQFKNIIKGNVEELEGLLLS